MSRLIEPNELAKRAAIIASSMGMSHHDWIRSPHRRIWWAYSHPMVPAKIFSEEAIALMIKLGL